MIWIGIDPGTHTGLAVWDGTAKRFLLVATVPLWQALREVGDIAVRNAGQVRVVFEDARQRTWFPAERNRSEYRGKLMGAGAVKRDSAIWQEFLEDNCIPYFHCKPQAGLTKWSADLFARYTGWKGRTSEHSRDAALLVWGKA